MRIWVLPVVAGTFAAAIMALSLGWVELPIKVAKAQTSPESRMEILYNEHIVYGSGLKSMDDQLTIMRDRENGNLCYVFLKKVGCIPGDGIPAKEPRP